MWQRWHAMQSINCRNRNIDHQWIEVPNLLLITGWTRSQEHQFMTALLCQWASFLGCIFLFPGIYFWTKKTLLARIPENFCFSCVFRGNFSQECGFRGGRMNSWFLLLSQDFFCRNSCRTEIPVFTPDLSGFLRIRPDSSRLIRIPVPAKCCLALASN